MQGIVIFIALMLAYGLGSLSGGLLLGRLFGQQDVRAGGSGNTGATNALRTGGRGFGMAVLVFDLLKGIIAAGLIPMLFQTGPAWSFVCGLLAVVGHVYPVFHRFHGGKGAATCIGVLSVLLPGSLLAGAVVWAGILVLTGYVGLATIVGMLSVAASSFLLMDVSTAGLGFVVVTSVLIVYTHRGNIQRMLAGTENRFDKVRIGRPK